MTEQKRACAVMLAALLVGSAGFVGVTAAPAARGANAGNASLAIPTIDPACKAVFDANDKTLDTPNHAYQEQADPRQKSMVSELITVGGERYLKVNGTWKKSRMTVAQTKAQEEENKKNAKVIACKRVGTESVNGQMATVYTEHSETEETKADGKVWISNSGVILKNEIELDTGEGTKTHVTIRYEYGDVKAPI
ncbi:MAG: hypothetical protein JO119_19935 [Acidobacteria bacterium]|nr:hypothetical protein [Acidobacteriota bacterium]